MPTYPVDESKYVIGGCVIDEDASKYHCINCDTRWVDPLLDVSRPFYLYLYISIENRLAFTRIFGVATAQLYPRLV